MGTLIPFQLGEDEERNLDSEAVRMIFASMRLANHNVTIHTYISPFSCVKNSLYIICKSDSNPFDKFVSWFK